MTLSSNPTGATQAVQTQLTPEMVWQRLREVIDPELFIDIVSLGLVYDVRVRSIQLEPEGTEYQVYILLTLTTPGCPLAGTFGQMIRTALEGLPGLEELMRQVVIELTFDPPWTPELLSEEARAELADIL